MYAPALSALPSGGSSDPVYVLGSLVRRVELYDPVHGRDVQTSGGDVCAEQHSGVLNQDNSTAKTKTAINICYVMHAAISYRYL